MPRIKHGNTMISFEKTKEVIRDGKKRTIVLKRRTYLLPHGNGYQGERIDALKEKRGIKDWTLTKIYKI